MLKIPDSLVEGFDISYRKYKKGMDYYNQGRIKSLKLYENHNLIMGVVRGTDDYKIRITFDDEGQIMSSLCNCSHGTDYPWDKCEHVTAVLIHLKKLNERGSFNNIIARREAKAIFKYFQPVLRDDRTQLRLQLIYEFDRNSVDSLGTASLFSLKAGVDRLYVVKDIAGFLKAIYQKKSHDISKNFIYNPDIHTLADKDKQLIEFLLEVYESSIDNIEFNSHTKIFRGKHLILMPKLLKRLFSLLEDRQFTAIIDKNRYENVSIINNDVPVSFDLGIEEDDLVLKINLEDDLYPITEDLEFFFDGFNFYKLSHEQIKYLSPFIRYASDKKMHKLIFTRDDRSRFISEVLPYLKKAGDIRVHEDVDKIILKEDLKSEVYFDRAGRQIKAKVKYIYGQYEIEHNKGSDFARNVDGSGKILLRDIDKENEVVDIFEKYYFTPSRDGFYLREDDKIYEFFQSGLDELAKVATVFYSEDFKLTMQNNLSFTVGVKLSEGNDLLDFSFNIDGVNRDELEKLFKALRKKKKYYRLKDGTFLAFDSERLDKLSKIIDDLEIKYSDLSRQSFQLPKYRAIYLSKYLKHVDNSKVETNSGYDEMVKRIENPEDLSFEVPCNLKPVLREYQHVGFKWLKTLAYYSFGGILADDMGLGKTLQILTLLLSEKEKCVQELDKGSNHGREGYVAESYTREKPSLVIAPTSLLYNWEAEVDKFAPELKTLVVSGLKNERFAMIKSIPEHDLIITSYPLIRRDIEYYKEYDFKYCIIDEAQHIKNPGSKAAKAVKQIISEGRFALTGTPMENSLSELWSIFDFVMPGYLYSHTKFMSKYERPIVRDRYDEALSELSHHIKPFIMRRLKTDVLKELPEKIENRVIAELTREQKKVYMAYLAQAKKEVTKEIEAHGFEKSQIRILALLTRLRQISCHPSLFLENYTGESGKLQLLQDIVTNALDGGHRILIFSQFTSMLQIIKEALELQDIDIFYLDGSTKAHERNKLVDSFNSGEGDVFLISLKAGGTGLNLTGADTVIHYDPWWNPAVEDQATDRAYRIGQTRVVHVLKLISKGTIEEKIEDLKEQKKHLTDAIIKPGENFISKMTQEEVMALFE